MATPAERLTTRQLHVHAEDVCEYCEQPIPPGRLEAVRGRIAARQRELSQEAARSLREEFAREREQDRAEGSKREILAREQGARDEKAAADQRASALSSEWKAREHSLQIQLTAHEDRHRVFEDTIRSLTDELTRVRTEDVAAAREQGRTQATRDSEAAVRAAQDRAAEADALALEARAAGERLQAEGAERERLAREQGAREAQVLADERHTALTMQLTQATEKAARAEDARRDAEKTSETTLQQRLREQKEALTLEGDQKVRETESRSFAERQRLQDTVAQLTRQLEQVSAHDRGEGAEINLYDVLKGAFDADKVKHVPKGVAGPDIIHDVMLHGQHCGRIIYDSKNRNDYKSEYAKKLRGDQIAAKADYAILVSRYFPKKSGQLHVESHVIVANPARVVVLAAILRQHLIKMHTLRLSNEAREAKSEALYKYFTSEPCRQLLETVEKVVKDLMEMDVAEQKAHAKIWQNRGKLLSSVLKAQGDLCGAIDRILGTAE
jgi:hypothetical protein